MTKPIKLWMREPRTAWQNDGGPIPRGFRGHLARDAKGLWIINPLQRVGKWHWVVVSAGQAFAFPTSMIKRFYSRKPPAEER